MPAKYITYKKTVYELSEDIAYAVYCLYNVVSIAEQTAELAYMHIYGICHKSLVDVPDALENGITA